MKRTLFLLSFPLFFNAHSWCQAEKSYSQESITNRIVDQVALFPKEKLYAQLDKSLYVLGENIWFRIWAVDAVLHQQITEQIAYVELINPLDSVVFRSIIKQDEGVLNGNIPLKANFPEGDYTFCAYTEIYKNGGIEPLYKKQITILHPYSSKFKSEINFRFNSDNNIIAEATITDLQTKEKTVPVLLKIRINNQPYKIIKPDTDSIYRVPVSLPENNIQRVILLEFEEYRKYFSIPFNSNDYDVMFFPEGGYLIQGENCKVAFKAISSGGFSENVTGTIVDNYFQEVTDFTVQHDGMGQFSFTPKEGYNYYALCKNEKGVVKRFVLPPAETDAYTLKAEFMEDSLLLTVVQSEKIDNLPHLYLLLHTRGIVNYFSDWDRSYTSVSFPMSKFPSGVMQAILLDSDLNPLSERLIFCNNSDQANAVVKTDLENYGPRQLVKAEVRITDSKGLPIQGSFSLSVTDDNDIKIDTTSSILTSLLLSSEIKGVVNNPAYYFQKNEQEVAKALDLVMLTNGWRRYNIPKIIQGELEMPVLKEYKGLPISGEVKTILTKRPVKKGKVSIFSWQASYFHETETDSAGRFTFDGIEFPDSSIFVVQALSPKNNRAVELFLNQTSFPSVHALLNIGLEGTTETINVEPPLKYIMIADTKYALETGFPVINLPEVLVTAKAPPAKEYRFSYYMPRSGQNVLTDDKINFSQYNSFSDILIHMPFVRSYGGDVYIDRMRYSLSGNRPAVIIIDDLIMRDYDIDMIDPSTIERIGVLKGSQATILGGAGAAGAIVITTKRGFTNISVPIYNIKSISPLGLKEPVEFYAPRYETEMERKNSNPDLRTTIYWNPNVSVTASGDASLDFFTADSHSTYSVIIEGVASDGSIIHCISKISRK